MNKDTFMELDEYKKIWTQYDCTLKRNLQCNEQLLINANLETFRKELNKPKLYDQTNVIISALLVPVFLFLSIKFTSDSKYLVSGIVFCLALCGNFAIGITKIRSFQKVDYYNAPIIQLQEQLTQLELILLRFRYIELYLMPFFTIPPIILLMKIMHNIDVFVHVKIFWLYAMIVMLATFAITCLINRFLYDKKLKNLNDILKDIQNYHSNESES